MLSKVKKGLNLRFKVSTCTIIGMKVLTESEDTICEHLCAYMGVEYPGVLFCHVPNEGAPGRYGYIRGKRQKRLGLRKGMVDYLFFGNSHDGDSVLLALEVKTERGMLSKTQKCVLEKLGEQDAYSAYVAYGYAAVISVVEHYFKGKRYDATQRIRQF